MNVPVPSPASPYRMFVLLFVAVLLGIAYAILNVAAVQHVLGLAPPRFEAADAHAAPVQGTSHEIPRVTLEDAQRQVPFTIPTLGWIPSGFKLGGAHVNPPDWANMYYVPTTPVADAPYAGFALQITRGYDPTQQFITGTTSQDAIFVHGQPATYVASDSAGMLRWEANGFSYNLSYSDMHLSREDVQRLAESVQ